MIILEGNIVSKGDKIIATDTKFNKDKDKTIMNEKIRSKEVRLIDNEGVNHGIVPTSKALEMADEAGLDLVLIRVLMRDSAGDISCAVFRRWKIAGGSRKQSSQSCCYDDKNDSPQHSVYGS